MNMPLNLEQLVPGFRLGHYIISSKLAEGGMGIVYRAFEPALERHVAIKILRPEYSSNPEQIKGFQNEARAVAALRHPNIVPIYYIGEEGGCAYFSMAFIHGETFEDWITRKQFFNEDKAFWFMRQAIAALESAFTADIIHLDIKPGNFMIDQNSSIMLSDFGLAQRIVGDEEENDDRQMFGTPEYISPEQIYRSKTDQRSDIYSLGATLFHMLVGMPPFLGKDMRETALCHLEKPFPSDVARMAGISKGWTCLMQKMMEKNPDDRFHDYIELRTALIGVNRFTHESKKTVRLLGTPSLEIALSVPRNWFDASTLHGLMAPTGPGWQVSKEVVRSSPQSEIARSTVLRAITTHPKPLNVDKMVGTIKELCQESAVNVKDLHYAIEKVSGYEYAIRSLAEFMFPPAAGAEPLSAQEVLETIGYERARNLALTFYSLNFEIGANPQYNFLPLWRHQLAVALIIDFMYDALDLRRSGLEYAAGTFHDIGKLVLAELFPETYFYAMARSLLYQIPLAKCERDSFGIDHAELGAFWLRHNDVPSELGGYISQHETPEKVNARAILSHAVISANLLAKQIGLGYSGNCVLGVQTWQELPSTRIVWNARRIADYEYNSFTADFLDQFEGFPDLL